jgi:phage terminase large subunit
MMTTRMTNEGYNNEYEKKDITLTEKQTEALYYLKDKTTTEVLFGGGAGGAKSTLGSYWLMKNCIQYPETRWLMGRAVKKRLKETTLKTFKDVVKKHGVSQYMHIVDNSDTITFRNGSEIIMHDLAYLPGDEDFDRLGSTEFTGAFIDETQEVIKKAKDAVKSRLRYRLDEYGLKPKLLMACNPSKGWLYREMYKPAKEGKLDKKKRFVQALAKDNPFISSSYIELLMELDKNMRERLLFGNWEYDDDPDCMLNYDQINDMFTNAHVFQNPNQKYITADIALLGSDCFLVVVWYGWVAVDFIKMKKSDGKQIVDKIRELKMRHGIPNRHLIYDADGVGGYLGGFFQGAIAFNAKGSPFEDKENPRGFYDLKTQCAYKAAAMADMCYLKCFAGSEHEDLFTEELEQLKRMNTDMDGKLRMVPKEVMKEHLGRSPDYQDNFIMRGYFEVAKPVGLQFLR